MAEEQVLSGEAIAEAVNAANLFRQIYGEPLIDDLPKAIVRDDENCVLARAFNFNCRISGWDDTKRRPEWAKDSKGYIWGVMFNKEDMDKAKALAEILGTSEYIYNNPHASWCQVLLPAKIAEIAEQFDSGLLDAKYYTIDEDGYIEAVWGDRKTLEELRKTAPKPLK